MTDDVKQVSSWRIILAALFDFITAFTIGGYIVAKMTGGTTENGFSLEGIPALMALALIIAYFVGARYAGGTIWQRLLKARRK